MGHCLCESLETRIIQLGVRNDDSVEVERCLRCGLVFLWPRSNERELELYYAEAYRREYGGVPVEERYLVDLREALVRSGRLRGLLPRGESARARSRFRSVPRCDPPVRRRPRRSRAGRRVRVVHS